MSKGISLTDYLGVLSYAAKTGAGKIASSVTASGTVQAETTVSGPGMPGPGLQAVLARSSGRSSRKSNAATADRVPKIADRMAKNALRQGAELLSGDK